MNLPDDIVDAHVHFWNSARLRFDWLAGLPALNRAFDSREFAAASAQAGVTKFIFVECGCEPRQALYEVEWISMLAKTEPRLKGIVAFAPMEKGAAVRAELSALANHPLVKGVRRNLQGEIDTGFCLQPDFIAGIKLLAEFDFTFDLCIRHDQLAAATELVRRVPEVRFVLDHFGKPPVKAGQVEPWATQLRALAELPNASCKISGLTTEADWENWKAEQLRPYFEVALGAFGSDRVLFGGDWPVCTLATDYHRWVEMVAAVTTSATEADRKKLFQTNAEKFYCI